MSKKGSRIKSLKEFGSKDNKSSYNECEPLHIRNSEPKRKNAEVKTPGTLPSRFPEFHASEQGPWSAMICYEACVRLCLHSLAEDSDIEASYFLKNDCVLLRNAFGLQSFLLQSEEELLGDRPSNLVTETNPQKSKKIVGKIKLQVGKIKMESDPQPGCGTIPSLKHEVISQQLEELNATLYSGWKAVKRVHVAPQVTPKGSISSKSLEYMRACAHYLKEVSKVLRKEFVTSHGRPSSLEASQDSIGDDLIVEVRDSKGKFCGRVLAQLAAIVEEPEAKNVGVQDNKSSYNECEPLHIRNSEPKRKNAEVKTPGTLPSRFPEFHASEQGPWSAMICYEACVRLCLHSLAADSDNEASYFLKNDCVLLRNAFGLQSFLLQSEEELLGDRPSNLVTDTTPQKSKKNVGKIKLQVGKIKMESDPQPGCGTIPSLKHEVISQQLEELNATLYCGWKAVKSVHVTPQVTPKGSISRKSLEYMRACARYLKEVSKVLREEFITSHGTPRSLQASQKKFSCCMKLKSYMEEDQVKTQPGSGETFFFLPESIGDDLIVEVRNSKGKFCGRVLAQLAAIVEEPSEKLKWWAIYHEPEHERIGRIQLHINYLSSLDEKTKCGLVAETSAYDLVLEVAMKAEQFQSQNLVIKGPWHWMVTQFASLYGFSDAYTKLRYLSYVMDVASPTKYCIDLIYDFLCPVIMKENYKATLSHQENRILAEIHEKVQHILALIFENYKSLDESCFYGIKHVFEPPTGTPAPAIASAIKLYGLLNNLLSQEAQLSLCRYFQDNMKD
ncbi:hypothetical protein F2Q68_00022969 [Brassica cretica]|uniref:Uncharacterized protein n=1 Tax=Brassica cretica TaxID=69181 RepID=A0A8S9G2T2_BRACR|nr:hypothetical protein F2Q68_00022969 [Brassica cretica]